LFLQEEYATFYAAIAPDGPQLGNPKTAKIFNKNFWHDFKQVLGGDHVIQDFSKCDFGPIRAHLEAKRNEKKAASKDEKEAAKAEKTALQEQYGFALVDGHLEKMGNYNVEPPGLFRGRGEHPKMGTVKKRVMPEDITLNVGTTGE
jgi:DNA topoisomerase I